MLAGEPDYRRREATELSGQAGGPHLRDTECWQDVFGRVGRNAWRIPTDHAALRVGMSSGRHNERRYRAHQWSLRTVELLATFLSIAVLMCGLSCKGNRTNPQRAYDRARSTFVHGNLI